MNIFTIILERKKITNMKSNENRVFPLISNDRLQEKQYELGISNDNFIRI